MFLARHKTVIDSLSPTQMNYHPKYAQTIALVSYLCSSVAKHRTDIAKAKVDQLFRAWAWDMSDLPSKF